MSSSYFTIIHIAVLAIIAIIVLLLCILAFKFEKKLFLPIIFTNFLVFSTLAVFLMFVIDKYTKYARLENVSSSRILQNESIVFKGTVRNIGRFTLSVCNFKAKLVNQALSTQNLNGSNVFKPSGVDFFGWFSSEQKNERPNVVEFKKTVAKNLLPGKSIDFSMSMPFPPYFTKVLSTTEINCY